jgi:hypothetical protein
MSLVEKLNWAREHHINPPIYVILEARQHGIDWFAFCSGQTVNKTAQCTANCAHCVEKGSGTIASDAAYCTTAAPQRNASVNSNNGIESRPSHGIVLNEMLKCHGASQNWLGLGTSLAPPAHVRSIGADEIVEVLSMHSERASSLSDRPPLPPPRAIDC